jgi:RNA polymerase sigma factor (sigma-70 family)
VLASSRPTAEATFIKLFPAIERIVAFGARRHHASADEAEEFGSYVNEKLIENDYGIIRKFEGRSTIETFLTTVVSNLFHDFRNREWGKWRPSAEARRGGPAAMLLERYLVRDSLPFDQACDALSTNHGITLLRAELERIAARLPVRYRRRTESEEVLQQTEAPDRADSAVVDERRLALWDRVISVVSAERAKLPPQDASIVALKFEDGRRLSEIAAILQLQQKPLYERLKKLMKQLRLALEAAGIDAAMIRDLLDD